MWQNVEVGGGGVLNVKLRPDATALWAKNKKKQKTKYIYIYMDLFTYLFRESRSMIWMLKGNLNSIKNCEINRAGFFTTKTRTPGLCLNCF